MTPTLQAKEQVISLIRVFPSLLVSVSVSWFPVPGRILGARLPQYYQVLTAPATKVRGSPASGWASRRGVLSPRPRPLSPPSSRCVLPQVLDQWFESEPLKATLATDAVIGSMTSPQTPGSG